MDNTSLMISLLGALRREMNGAVADAMHYYGKRYGLNYGVSLPTIRTIAAEQPTNNSLALCCNKLLHRKRSPGLSLFSKRIKLRVSECNANWFVITQRTEATSLKANTAKPGGSFLRGGVRVPEGEGVLLVSRGSRNGLAFILASIYLFALNN